jgi:hypothetical protein
MSQIIVNANLKDAYKRCHFLCRARPGGGYFYAWRRKYVAEETPSPEGFCKIVTRPETAAKTLRLPSGLALAGVSMAAGLESREIASKLWEED